MEAGHLLRVIDKLIKFYIISHNIFKWIKSMLLIKVNIRQISKYCALNKYLIYLNICLSVWPSGYSRRLLCERVWVRNPEQASLTRATILPRSVKWAATIRQWVTAVEDCECKPQAGKSARHVSLTLWKFISPAGSRRFKTYMSTAQSRTGFTFKYYLKKLRKI